MVPRPAEIWGFAAAIAVIGCAAPAAEVQSARPPVEKQSPKTASPGPRAPIARVPAGTVGPFLAPVGETWLTTWAQTDGDSANWYSRALDENGQPRTTAGAIALSLGQVGLVRFRATPTGGAVVLFTARAAENPTVDLHALLLDDAGQLLAPPFRVAEDLGDVVWVEAAAVADQTVALWAERRGNRAEIRSAIVGTERNRSQPTLLRDEVAGWQLARARGTSLLATVSSAGAVALGIFNQAGELTTTAAVAESGAVPSIDLVSTPKGFVLAFVRQRRMTTEVVTALVGDDGNLLTQPVEATAAIGNQSLVRLVGGNPASLVFRNEDYEPDDMRIAALSHAGLASGAQSLIAVDASLPQPLFAERATGGVAGLLWACTSSAGCEQPLLPTLVHLDRRLTIERVDPWDLDGPVPDLAWDLQCGRQGCLALVARFGEPTEVFTQSASPQAREWVVPVRRAASQAPRLIGLDGAFETTALADLVAVPGGTGTLLTTLSDFDPNLPYEIPDEPAPDGRLKPVRAVLTTHWLPPTEEYLASDSPAPDPVVLSYRARSVSGIAVANKGERNLVAWSAIDGQNPQVFTTLIDSQGRKVSQRMQTRSTGEVRSVTADAARKGWLLAWIDERGGAPHAYATRLEDNLNRRTSEVAIAPARCSGLDARVVGDEMWLLAGLETEGGHELALVKADDALKPLGDPTPVASARGAVASPQLLVGTDSKWAAWLEAEADDTTGTSNARARWIRLDDTGRPVGQPVSPRGYGAAISLRGTCIQNACRLLVGQRGRTGDSLAATTLKTDDQPTPLLRLVGKRAAVRPTLLGGEIWLHDDIAGSSRQGVYVGEVSWD